LDSGPDSPQFSSIHLNPARLTWTPPGRAALPRRPNIVFAPNQIQSSDSVGFCRIQPTLDLGPWALDWFARTPKQLGERARPGCCFPRPRGKPCSHQNRRRLFCLKPKAQSLAPAAFGGYVKDPPAGLPPLPSAPAFPLFRFPGLRFSAFRRPEPGFPAKMYNLLNMFRPVNLRPPI